MSGFTLHETGKVVIINQKQHNVGGHHGMNRLTLFNYKIKNVSIYYKNIFTDIKTSSYFRCMYRCFSIGKTGGSRRIRGTVKEWTNPLYKKYFSCFC